MLILVSFLLLLVTLGSCEDGYCPEPEVKEYQGYLVSRMPELPAVAGSVDIELSCSRGESVIPIVVLTSSKPILSQPESWQSYEDTNLILLSERVFGQAGYDTYPNDIEFGYAFCWAKFSTYKYPGTDKGVLRVSWEENKTNAPRRIFVYLKNQKEEVLEVVQLAFENS